MITLANYAQATSSFDFSAEPAHVKDSHDYTLENLDLYNADADIKELIDIHIAKMNVLVKSSSKSTTGKKPSTSQSGEKKPAKKSAGTTKNGGAPGENKPKTKPEKVKKGRVKKETPPYTGTLVENISQEVALTKRFVNVHNKVKTRKQLASILMAINKAFTLKLITKKSALADIIVEIQRTLVGVCNSLKKDDSTITIQINDADLAEYVAVAGGEKVYKSIAFLKQYLRLQGQSPDEAKVKSILANIEKAKITAEEDPYYDRIKAMVKVLNTYVTMGASKLELKASELNGLQGVIAGLEKCTCEINGLMGIEDETMQLMQNKEVMEKGLMTVGEAKVYNVKPIELPAKYKALIGNYTRGSHIHVYGFKGNGKSTFLLPFAEYLADNVGPTCYVAGEQFATGPFAEMLQRLKISSKNLHIASDLSKINPDDYKFIFLDSKESLAMELEDYKQFKKDHPFVSTILVSQVTKEGSARGSEKWGHEVDAEIWVENGVATTVGRKNRMGGQGEFKIDFSR